jgi:hypothetical protein
MQPHQSAGEIDVIELRRAQLNFGDKLIADEVEGLHEEWMDHADQVLGDEQILTIVYEALGKRNGMYGASIWMEMRNNLDRNRRPVAVEMIRTGV